MNIQIKYQITALSYEQACEFD